MKMADESGVDRRKLELGLVAVVFVGSFLYAWKGIQSHLLYYGFGVFTAYPVFSWEGSFLWSALSTPGGALNSLAALLAQAYCSPLLGALVIVAALAALFAGVRNLLRSTQADRLRDLAWAPVVLAMMVYNRCDDPLAALLAVSLPVGMAALYNTIVMKTLAVRVGAFLILFAVTYWLAGGSAFVFACTVCLIESLLYRRGIAAVIEAVLASGGAFVLGRWVFGLAPRAIWTIGTFWDSARNGGFSPLSSLLMVVLYAFVPGLAAAVFLGRIPAAMVHRARRGCRGTEAKPAKDDEQAHSRRIGDSRLGIGVRMLAVVVMAALGLVSSRNHIRDERILNYHARLRDWDHVIAQAHRMRGRRTFTRAAVFDIDRALAHQGRLGEEFCAYPQDETKTLFLRFDDMTGRLQHSKLLELYLDLGCPNAAEKNAYELLDNEGPSPFVLEALVRIHLVKGQYESARIAFGAMRKYAGCREYVRQWADIIADPARAEDHPLILAWRRVKGTVDHVVGGIAFESMLRRLLQNTPDHRVAFEYLMANYLLKHQRAEFMSCLPLLKPLGYTQLPRHYAEAILVHSLETKSPADAQGWTIAADVQGQFRETSDVVRNARGNNQAVFDTLAPKYGDTYTFYSMFNVCGAR